MIRKLPCWLLMVVLTIGAVFANADDFENRSLTLRTALRDNPEATWAVDELVRHYGAARSDELIALYESHLTLYPKDTGARGTLIRILLQLRRPEAIDESALAVELFPESGWLAMARYEVMASMIGIDGSALGMLSRAIRLSPESKWKRGWIDELVELAPRHGYPALAEAPLKGLAVDAADWEPEKQMGLASQMLDAGFPDLALEVVTELASANLAPELVVDREMLAARCEEMVGRQGEAGERLDQLLGKLTADYWRRGQISSWRAKLFDGDGARKVHLEAARIQHIDHPTDETKGLDLIQMVMVEGMRGEALRVIQTLTESVVESDRVEEVALWIYEGDKDRSGLVAYLKERSGEKESGSELQFRLVTELYLLGKAEEAAEEMEGYVESMTPDERFDAVSELGVFLREADQIGEANVIFEALLQERPERWDVRKELALGYLTADNKGAVRRLFEGEELVHSLEMVEAHAIGRFLNDNGMKREARIILEGELVEALHRFDILCELGRAGDTKRFNEARLLANTEQSFRKWVEIGVELSDDGMAFLGEEYKGAKEWEKLVIFDAMSAHGGGSVFREVLKKEGADSEVAQPYWLNEFEEDVEEYEEVVGQLESQVMEVVDRKDDLRLRLALAHERVGNTAEADAAMKLVNLDKVTEVRLLEKVDSIEAMGRLAEMVETDGSRWESFVDALEEQGAEGRLRYALQRWIQVTDGVGKRRLEERLGASFWRSIEASLTKGDADEALGFIEGVERSGILRSYGMEALWVDWVKARALVMQGKGDAAGEVATKLAEALARLGRISGGEVWVKFPNGVSGSRKAVLAALRSREVVESKSNSPELPKPEEELVMRWGFRATPDSEIVRVVSFLDGKMMGVLDSAGVLSGIDSTSGEVVWQDDAGVDLVSPPSRRRRVSSTFGHGWVGDEAVEESRHPTPLVEMSGRLVTVMGNRVRCLDGETGEIVWEALAKGTQDMGRFLTSGDHQVYLLVAETGEMVAIDGATGASNWEAIVDPGEAVSSGAEWIGGRLVVYGGDYGKILDGETGQELWSIAGVSAVTAGEDGQAVLAGGGKMRLVNISRPMVQEKLVGQDGVVMDVKHGVSILSATGETVVVGNEEEIDLTAVGGWSGVGNPEAVVVGDRLIATGNHGVGEWDLENGHLVSHWDLPEEAQLWLGELPPPAPPIGANTRGFVSSSGWLLAPRLKVIDGAVVMLGASGRLLCLGREVE